MSTIDNKTHTEVGTNGRDSLRGHSQDPWRLTGLDGDDFYVLRVFQAYERTFDGTIIAYKAVDTIVEQPNGGYDTVELVDGYNSTVSVSASQLANIEKIEVSPNGTHGWTIASNDLANLIIGGGGADQIDGAGGADTIRGGSANDVLHGGAGNDKLFGEDGDDRLYGDSGRNTLNGGAGNDTFFEGSGGDTFVGGAGLDTVVFSGLHHAVVADLAHAKASTGETFSSIEGATGTNYADTLLGSSGDNVLTGNAGNDKVLGGNGNDTLDGGLGNDVLQGGGGNDLIKSGGGADSLTGGSGSDTFEFDFKAKHTLHNGFYIFYKREVSFRDTITDFTDGVDHIAIHPFTQASAGVAGTDKGPTLDDIFVRQVGADAVVSFGNPDNSGEQNNVHKLFFGSVTLKGFSVANLSTSDFTLV